MKEKSPSDTAAFVDAVASKHGWVANPDAEFTASLVEGLTVNWNRYGYFLCPCRDTEGSREADAPVVCPCAYAQADIDEFGHCFCALYLRPDFAAEGGAPAGIPDRRFA